MSDVLKRVSISKETSDAINKIAKERDLYPADVIRHILDDYVEARKNNIDPLVLSRMNELTEVIRNTNILIESGFNNMDNRFDTIANLNTGSDYLVDDGDES